MIKSEKIEEYIAHLQGELKNANAQISTLNELFIAQQDRIKELEAGQGEAVAWLHIMKMEFGHLEELTDSKDSPFGKPDIDYDQSFTVGSEPLYRQAQPATAKVDMKSVMDAICSISGMPMLTSNQCAALAAKLNGGAQ